MKVFPATTEREDDCVLLLESKFHLVPTRPHLPLHVYGKCGYSIVNRNSSIFKQAENFKPFLILFVFPHPCFRFLSSSGLSS